jgi:hypothetical protein
MNQEDNAHAQKTGDPRLLVRWTRRYAKSRTISFLVQWVFIVLMVLIIGGAVHFTTQAYRNNQMALFYPSVIAMIAAILVFAWISMSNQGGKLIWRITQRIYGREGYVSDVGDEVGHMPWWANALGGGLVIYHLVGALLISFEKMHVAHIQPFSALYMSPFLLVIIIYQRLGFWAWCWPILYAIHALLVFTGKIDRFTGIYELLNLVVPAFGYGLVSIVIGHLYSRFALWKVRSLAQSGLSEDDAA